MKGSPLDRYSTVTLVVLACLVYSSMTYCTSLLASVCSSVSIASAFKAVLSIIESRSS